MMDSKRTISISEARKRIFEIADEVQIPNKVYTLTADGKPKVVIMSAEEYESLVETIEVLRDFPNIQQDFKEAELAIKSGEYKTWTTFDGLEKKWGLAVAEKPKKKYVPSGNKTKGRKSTR